MDIEGFVTELGQIARLAGERIMEIYADEAAWQATYKADFSPLTAADMASHGVIAAGLAQLPVVYPLVSEEDGTAVPYEVRRHYERFWLVDPLDGTREFVQRSTDFTVNVALVERGVPVLGLVYLPATTDLYWAVRGKGAFLQRHGQEQRLQAAVYEEHRADLTIVASRSHMNAATRTWLEEYPKARLVSRGSSLKLLLLAEGKAHLYPRLSPTMEWDTAAAQVILEEAGGVVSKYPEGGSLQYNKPDLRNPYFVATARPALTEV